MITCPKCNRIVMDKTQDGGYKVRSRMIIFKDGKAVALCPSCKEPIEVPLCLGEVPESLPKPRYIIREGRQ